MWRRSTVAMRRALTMPVAVCVLLALPATAGAGGWAVTTLDALPAEGFRAGESYRLGYTIRQHGQTPVSNARTSIRVRSSGGDGPAGEWHVFEAVPGSRPGHYLAEVRFPTAGEWTWEVDQGPFGPQKLGTITVLPSPALDVAADAPRPSSVAPWATLSVAVVLGLLVSGLLIFARRPGRGAAAASGPALTDASGSGLPSR